MGIYVHSMVKQWTWVCSHTISRSLLQTHQNSTKLLVRTHLKSVLIDSATAILVLLILIRLNKLILRTCKLLKETVVSIVRSRDLQRQWQLLQFNNLWRNKVRATKIQGWVRFKVLEHQLNLNLIQIISQCSLIQLEDYLIIQVRGFWIQMKNAI